MHTRERSIFACSGSLGKGIGATRAISRKSSSGMLRDASSEYHALARKHLPAGDASCAGRIRGTQRVRGAMILGGISYEPLRNNFPVN